MLKTLVPTETDVQKRRKPRRRVKMQAISLRVTQRQYTVLRLQGIAQRRHVSELIRDAVDHYLEELPIKPGQEWFWASAWQQAEMEAEEDLQAGRFETFDTMGDFLASLE